MEIIAIAIPQATWFLSVVVEVTFIGEEPPKHDFVSRMIEKVQQLVE